MKQKIINVTINKNAELYLETENYKGESCLAAIKDMMDEFFDLNDVDYKPEYYEKDQYVTTEVKLK